MLLELATHPILVKQLQTSPLEVLKQALDAHRYAFTLDPENPDTLFNTAQALTAIAELYARDPDRGDQDSLQLLEEALELQNRCLAVQELRLEESIRQQDEAATQTASENTISETVESQPGRLDENGESASTADDNKWFSIVEPVTKDTLVDTILAEIGTLTTLCSILSTSTSTTTSSLAWIEEFSSKLIRTKLPVLLQDAEAERVEEVALARANFVSMLLEAGYRTGSIDWDTYRRERDEVFHAPELNLENNVAALVASSNSLCAFNTALAEGDQSTAASRASQRWNALSAATANMTAASKVSGPVPEDIAETHFIRGNCALLQYQLGQPPLSYQPAVANTVQLLKNADLFYRNASKLYQDDEQRSICRLRAVVSQALLAGNAIMSAVAGHDQTWTREWTRSQLDDMIDESLISPLLIDS